MKEQTNVSLINKMIRILEYFLLLTFSICLPPTPIHVFRYPSIYYSTYYSFPPTKEQTNVTLINKMIRILEYFLLLTFSICLPPTPIHLFRYPSIYYRTYYNFPQVKEQTNVPLTNKIT